MEICPVIFRGGVATLDILYAFVSFSIIMSRLVAETVIDVNTEFVLIEEKSSGSGQDKCTIQGDSETGGDKRSFGNGVVPMKTETRQYCAAHTQGTFRRIRRTAQNRPPNILRFPNRITTHLLVITLHLFFCHRLTIQHQHRFRYRIGYRLGNNRYRIRPNILGFRRMTYQESA